MGDDDRHIFFIKNYGQIYAILYYCFTTSNEYDKFLNVLFPLVNRIKVYNLILYKNTF